MAKKKRPKFSFYKRNGVFYVRFWDEDSKSYTPAKSTKETNRDEAVTKAKEMFDSKQLVKRESDPLFIDELVEYWTERTGVCQAYRTDIVNRITKKAAPSKHLKNVRMSEIKHSHINRLKEDLIKTDSPAAVNNLIKNIKTFIRWANSLDYLQVDFTSKIPLVKTIKGKRGFLEPEEMQALTSVEWHDIRTKAAVCLGMWAGMRWGEVRALQWGDIDFEKNTIDIRRNYVDDTDRDGNPIYKEPKAGSNRKWPYLVFPELKNVLLQLYDKTPFQGKDDLVLVNVGNRSDKQYLLKQYKPLYYAHIQKNFHLMLEAAGVSMEEQTARRLSYHSLRHSFTSFMATTAPAAAVMGLTGHENEKVYEGYRHNVKSASIDALKAANAEMNKFRKTPTGNDTPGMIN